MVLAAWLLDEDTYTCGETGGTSALAGFATGRTCGLVHNSLDSNQDVQSED